MSQHTIKHLSQADQKLQINESPSDRAQIVLVYDKECPACDNYCQVVQIRETVGDLVIINAREDTAIMHEITAAGFDIDDGMVLKMGEQMYYGADAIHALALISSRAGVFNRLNYWIFKSKTLARVVYPAMKAGRVILLKLLRKSRVNNLHIPGRDQF